VAIKLYEISLWSKDDRLTRTFVDEKNPFLTFLTPEQRSRVEATQDKFLNSRKLLLHVRSWKPNFRPDPKALIFYIHGYGSHSGYDVVRIGYHFAAEGYYVFALDYEGHGRSEGLSCYFRDSNTIVEDCLAVTAKMTSSFDPQIKRFVMSESLGGAIAIQLLRRQRWNGAVFMAPMCRISENMRPSEPLASILKSFVPLFPTLAIVPSKTLQEEAARDPQKRAWLLADPLSYHGQPRLATALSLLNTTDDVSAHLHEIDVPILILHGVADKVTDPENSRVFYERARTPVGLKQLILYPDFCHDLLSGEVEQNALLIFNDISKWLSRIAISA